MNRKGRSLRSLSDLLGKYNVNLPDPMTDKEKLRLKQQLLILSKSDHSIIYVSHSIGSEIV